MNSLQLSEQQLRQTTIQQRLTLQQLALPQSQPKFGSILPHQVLPELPYYPRINREERSVLLSTDSRFVKIVEDSFDLEITDQHTPKI